MRKSRLVASAALPFVLVALTACGSPAETPKPEQPPAVSTPPALTREAVEAAVFEAAPPLAANGATTPVAPDPAIARAAFALPHPAEGGASIGSAHLVGGSNAVIALTKDPV